AILSPGFTPANATISAGLRSASRARSAAGRAVSATADEMAGLGSWACAKAALPMISPTEARTVARRPIDLLPILPSVLNATATSPAPARCVGSKLQGGFMAGGLVALLDDVATLAKLAATSIDDVAGAAGRAGTKAAGVVIDDAAVTPKYVVGLSPDRELPIIYKITKGSLRNKLVFLLPAALLLSELAPWLIVPLLMVGGAYLCFEATEKIWEALTHPEHTKKVLEIVDPKELEERQVSGAVRTDFILSAEIMAIALSQLPELSLLMRAI